ncbi:hypothetical protein [Lentilactobacillus kisonensis]|uniref:Uncharacterized protein n=2 Tax=Lentilactobacillus kisonensis TaxID=481722 RepID=H1LIC2_9LACO|nr:hypothetical protein [Lentilactobacillus kisonensis]EHO49875.1 hypothetical protein HMPREF9104_02363 [Lentilactobacillus kisonensis F0435]KRL20137.1 hypothetical protein FC98_GL001849 [Lentilactobacillus kisonensis DSM 19906 = JCM 15041]
MTFDRDKIQQSGFKDTVIVFLTQGKQIDKVHYTNETIVRQGDDLAKVQLKQRG